MLSKRRELLKLGAVASALAALPFGRKLAAATLHPAARAALGYWQGGAAIEDFSAVRAGWTEACAKSATRCDAEVHGGLIDASQLTGRAGEYRLRVLGAELDAMVRIDADYGVAQHRFWRSWQEGARTSHAARSVIRWQAAEGNPLQLTVTLADDRLATVGVPAHPGIYVLMLDEASNTRWTGSTLVAPDAAYPLNLRLQAVQDRLQYLLLAVERHVEKAAA